MPERALRRFGTARFRHGEPVHALALSPDGRTIATAGGGDIRFWETTTGKLRGVLFPGNQGWIFALGFSADGTRLVSTGADPKSHRKGQLIVWDVPEKRPLWTISTPGWVRSAAISPDGQTVVYNTDNGTLQILNGATGAVRHELTPPEAAGRQPNANFPLANCVAISPDGQQVAALRVKSTLCLWDVATGQVRKVLAGVTNLRALAFTPDGKGLATSHLKDRNPTSELSGLGESEIRFLDLTTGGVKWAVSSEQVPVFSLAFSPDGRRLASGEWKGRVFLRDAANGQPVRQFDTLYGSTNGVAFAPDGKLLYAVGTLGRIFVWNTVTGESRFPEVSHASGVVDLSLSPDGQTLATAGGDGDKTIRLWDLKSGQTRVILRGPDKFVGTVQFLRDGRRLVSGNGDGTVRLWDGVGGRELTKLIEIDKNWGTHTALSPDGKFLAIGELKNVRLWDLAAGKEVRRFTGHDGIIQSLSFSPEGAFLATLSPGYMDEQGHHEDFSTRVWQVATGVELFRHTGPNPGVFTPDGRGLLFLSEGKVLNYDFLTGQERSNPGWNDVVRIVSSPGASWWATTHRDGSIRLRATPWDREFLLPVRFPDVHGKPPLVRGRP